MFYTALVAVVLSVFLGLLSSPWYWALTPVLLALAIRGLFMGR